MYGFVENIEDTPADNVWTESREIKLNDESIVFGYEGATEIDNYFLTAKLFNEWRTANTPQEEIG
tara:strand:+ start:455 stop:649 length:195 start_codon:yes stop_codon:yes gene_type:complete